MKTETEETIRRLKEARFKGYALGKHADAVLELDARIAELTTEVASLRLGLASAINVAESWIHDQLDGTSSLPGALKELDIARNALNEGV